MNKQRDKTNRLEGVVTPLSGCFRRRVDDMICIMSGFVSLFVCLFVWSFASRWKFFHSFGDVIIAGEGLQILTNARHLRQLSSDGSLACHTYCDTAGASGL